MVDASWMEDTLYAAFNPKLTLYLLLLAKYAAPHHTVSLPPSGLCWRQGFHIPLKLHLGWSPPAHVHPSCCTAP